MKSKAKFVIAAFFILALVVVLILSNMNAPDDKNAMYTVTAQQWREALGDEAHIQTICRNVTVEIFNDETQEQMVLATANGGLMFDYAAKDMKHICVPSESGFVTYIYQYSGEKWEKYEGKTDVVGIALNTYLPGYVDAAMAGLQGEFKEDSYNEEEKCYIITVQRPAAPPSQTQVTMHCRVYFEQGQLVRLETEMVSQYTQTLKLYNIGKTKVEAPVDGLDR